MYHWCYFPEPALWFSRLTRLQVWPCHSGLSMAWFHRWPLRSPPARCPSASGAPQTPPRCDRRGWAQYSSGDFLHRTLSLQVPEMVLNTQSIWLWVMKSHIWNTFWSLLYCFRMMNQMSYATAACWLWGSSQKSIQNLSSHKTKLCCQFLYPKTAPNTFLHQYVCLNLH